jgi:hypothetical protein
VLEERAGVGPGGNVTVDTQTDPRVAFYQEIDDELKS